MKSRTLLLACSVMSALFFATLNGQSVIPVTAGTDKISAAYVSAASGDILELTSDGGIYQETSKLVVSKNITIRAAAGLFQRPTLTSGSVDAMIEISADLLLEGVILDGSQGGALSAVGITTKPSTSGYDLKVLKSDFINLKNAGGSKGFGIFGDPTSVVDSVFIQDCFFAHILNMGISFNDPLTSTGSVNHFAVDNSTFWDINSEAIYVDGFDTNVGTKDPGFSVNRVTTYACASYNIIPHYIDSARISNSIVVLAALNTGSAPAKIYGLQSKVENFLYYNTRDIDLSSGATSSQLVNLAVQKDPLFFNAAVGDFSIGTSSPAYNTGSDGKSLGDSRWWPQSPANVTLSSSNPSVVAGTIGQGSTRNLIYKFKLSTDTSGAATINTVNFTSAGTYVASDITKFQLFFKATDDFSTASQIGTDIISSLGTGPHSFSSLTQTIASNSTGYFYVAATVSGSGTLGNGISVSAIGTSDLTFKGTANKSGTAYDGSQQTIVNALLTTVTLSSPNPSVAAGNVGQGTSKNMIYKFQLTTDQNGAATLNTVNFTSAGTYVASDVTKFQLYYRATDDLSTAVQIGTDITSSLGTGSHSFSSLSQTIAASSSGYFSITADISSSGTLGNGVSVSAIAPTDVIFSATVNKTGTAYAGDQSIITTLTGVPTNIHWGTTNNTLNGLTVTWNNLTLDDSLRWGYTGNYEMGVFPGVRRNNYKTGIDPQYLFDHKFPKLTPSSKIYYSLKSGGIWGSMKTFTTSVDTASNKFTFIAAADCQMSTTDFQKISTMAAAEKADFYLQVGDIIDNALYPDLWKQFYDYGTEFLENTLNFYTHGNHVYYDTESANATLNQLVLPGNEKWYSFKQGNTLFICLLSEGELSTQLPYVKDVLKNTDATWIVVYFHRPFFCSGGHAGEMDALIPTWWKTFDDYGVNVIINGHEHTYTRSKPMNLNVSSSAPVSEYGSNLGQGRLQMLAGSFGAPRYNLETGWWVNTTKSVFDYVRFRVDSNSMHFDAIDIDNKIIDSLTLFSDGARQPSLAPGFYFIAPSKTNDTISFNYKVHWTDSVEPTDSANAVISLYYTADTSLAGTLIAGNIKVTDPQNYFTWDVVNVPPGAYFIYALISDGKITPIKKCAVGKVIIIPDIIPPPPATNLTGAIVNGKINLSWINPTRIKDVEKMLGNFENGLDGFAGAGNGTSTGSLLQTDQGYIGKGLLINYNIAVAWEQYAGVKAISGYPDYSSTHVLDFWYKGDGSSRALRIIAEQDNDRNGKSDDWWYNETLNLSSTTWKHAQLDLTTFAGLSWHTNVKPSFDLSNMANLDFIIPSATAGGGTVTVDEVKVTGQALPAPDFKQVVVMRKADSFPAGPHDGVSVYQGNSESCVDSTTDHSKIYYYAVFASDYAVNYSGLDSTSVWKSSPITGAHESKDSKIPVRYELSQNYPNPFNPTTTIKFGIPKAGMVDISVFNAIGQKVKTLVNDVLNEGYYSVEFNSDNHLPSGIYFFRIQSGDFSDTKKMVLMK